MIRGKNRNVSKLLACVLVFGLCMCSFRNDVFAYSSTNTERAYSYYYGRSMADIESRIWISTGGISAGFATAKNHFDATSSSWVFNLVSGVYITNHVNSMTLNKTMAGVELTVEGSGVSGTITNNDGNIFSMETPSANSYYRGMTVKNACLEFPWYAAQIASVTATSSQRVFIDGQLFSNSTDVTGYYLGPKII